MGVSGLRLIVPALAAAVSLLPAQEAGAAAERIRAGLLALNGHDIPTAQEHLEKAVEEAPDDPRGWLGLAQIYAILNLHRQAHNYAEEAARLDGGNPTVQHALSMFYAEYGNWAEAARWEASFAASDQADSDAPLRAASMYLQADMPRRAVEIAAADLEKRKSPQLHNVIGKAYETVGEAEPARRHLERAVESLPYEESLHFDLGYFHLRHRDFDAAAAAFLHGRKYFDKSAAIDLGLGIARYGQRRFPDAVDAFLRAAHLAPAMEQPHAFLGRVLQHAPHRLEDAVERLRVFHQEHSKSYLGPFLYGQILLAQHGAGADADSLGEIEKLFRESLERREDFWEANFELGALLEKQRRYEEAEKHLRRAVELNPESSKPRYRLARVYRRLGKIEAARAESETHRRLTEKEREAMASGGMAADLMPAAPEK